MERIRRPCWQGSFPSSSELIGSTGCLAGCLAGWCRCLGDGTEKNAILSSIGQSSSICNNLQLDLWQPMAIYGRGTQVFSLRCLWLGIMISLYDKRDSPRLVTMIFLRASWAVLGANLRAGNLACETASALLVKLATRCNGEKASPACPAMQVLIHQGRA